MDFTLDATQVRALGCLMEKELSTPEYCPLSLNALVNACNQKTNRQPVLALDADTVDVALRSLKDHQLVVQSDASRVPKFWQALSKKCRLIDRETALLCLLMLRGPQTAAELRARGESLCAFDGPEQAAEALDNLTTTGLIVQLPRQPGQKEPRYAHLLGGVVETDEPAVTVATAPAGPSATARIEQLETTVAGLQEELRLLRQEFTAFRSHFA
ncbi:MAG: DUF480 domain-containing protein [Desulfobulbus sp.]|jgi:uncharacterized protein YceH (UPF0502 family)|nr:DUF480 domain-containing protein [Desulfobulbus sp.]